MRRLAAGLALAAALSAPAAARITPNSSGSVQNQGSGATQDIFCQGGRVRGNVVLSTTEVCLDYNGSWLPTGGNANINQTLGVSSLPWTAIYVSTILGGSATTTPVFSPNLSSFTVANATGSFALTTLATCMAKSSVSVSLPVGISTIWVGYVGSSSATVLGSTVSVGVLIDGGYATFAGVAQTSAKGILSVGNGAATAGVGGNDLNLSFGPLPISGLASGSHTLCLLEDSTSGTVTIDVVNEVSAFEAYYLP